MGTEFPPISLTSSHQFPTLFPVKENVRNSAGKGEASTPFEEADWKRVGETLRNFRETRGFTPDEFASGIGISRPYLANIEAGRKKLTNILLAKSAEKLKIPQLAIMRAVDGDER